MRQRWTVAEVKIRLMCGERRDLFIIPNTQAHLWNTVEVMSQLGFAWLLLGRLVDLHWWCNTWWQLQNELWSLRKHFVCQRKEKRIQTDQEILHHAARQQPKHTAKTTKEFIRGKKWKVLDLPSQFPDSNCIDAIHLSYQLKRRVKGKTTTESVCGKSLEKHQKRRRSLVMSVVPARCSYCD